MQYRLSRSIIPDNQRKRRVKLDSLAAGIVERADTYQGKERSSQLTAQTKRAKKKVTCEQDTEAGQKHKTYPKIESLSIFAVQKSASETSCFQI